MKSQFEVDADDDIIDKFHDVLGYWNLFLVPEYLEGGRLISRRMIMATVVDKTRRKIKMQIND